MWIVDFPPGTPKSVASKYERPFEYLQAHLLTARQDHRNPLLIERWWQHERPRPDMRRVLAPLKRYLATPEVAKHRPFVWLTPEVLPDHQLIVFATDDDYVFGVLHSQVKIRAGQWPPKVEATTTPKILTVDEAVTEFVKWFQQPRPGTRRKGANGKRISEASDASRSSMICCHWIHEQGGYRFGALPLREVRAHHLETIVNDYRVQGRPASTVNKICQLLRGLTKCALANGYIDAPILTDDATFLRKDTENKRTRRLSPEEQARLMKACGPRLRAMAEAALETGCRLGELIGMTWAMADLDNRMIRLPASLTKTSEPREIPITPRVQSILEMRRLDPAGKELPPTAFVFGDELGAKVKSIKRGWATATRNAGLSDLRFHDLRRECASRLLESGLALHFVSRLFIRQCRYDAYPF